MARKSKTGGIPDSSGAVQKIWNQILKEYTASKKR